MLKDCEKVEMWCSSNPRFRNFLNTGDHTGDHTGDGDIQKLLNRGQAHGQRPGCTLVMEPGDPAIDAVDAVDAMGPREGHGILWN